MTDPFARIRDTRASRQPALPPPEAIAQYAATNYLNRIWVLPLLLLWAIAFTGVAIAFGLYERDIREAIPYGTLFMVVVGILTFASIGLVFPVMLRRRRWVLFPDRLEITQRPLLWPFGRHIAVTLPLDDITAANRGELIGNFVVVEIVTRSGRRYRLSPGMSTEPGLAIRTPDSAFDPFMTAIATAIERRGLQRPPGGKLITLWDTGLGIGILVLLLAICAVLTVALIGMAIWMESLQPLKLIFILAIFAALFWPLLTRKLRERRDA